jgi:hypothetical protein
MCPYPVMRVVAAILLFMMLGQSMVNAKSSSHELIAYTQLAHDTQHAPAGDDDLDGVDELDAVSHQTHEHDPTDHTHDIPLRFLPTAALPSFLTSWEEQRASGMSGVHSFPLERPPRLVPLAWSIGPLVAAVY